MRIYKVGYKSGTKVSRIDTSFGRRQQSYWTYCFKAFSAERQPDGYRGKGFNERTFVIMCSAGNPQYDIAEVISPAGDKKYKTLLDELLDLRNLLLVYRLLHYNDIIPDIQLTIKNRDKQLCKPLIRLFQNSKEAVSEIIIALSKLLLEKKQRKENTLEARLYSLILDLVAYHGLTLKNELIWSTFKEEVEGTDNPNKPQSYDTIEYYTISQRRITDILVDKFGAIRAHDGNSRILRFDQDKLNKLASNYAAVDTIEIIREGSNNSTNEEKEDKKSADTNISNTSNASTGNIDYNAEVSFNEKRAVQFL